MTLPLLQGVRITSGRDEHNRPVVCQHFRAKDDQGIEREVTVVLYPREARAHAALLLRQAQRAEEAERAERPILRVVR